MTKRPPAWSCPASPSGSRTSGARWRRTRSNPTPRTTPRCPDYDRRIPLTCPRRRPRRPPPRLPAVPPGRPSRRARRFRSPAIPIPIPRRRESCSSARPRAWRRSRTVPSRGSPATSSGPGSRKEASLATSSPRIHFAAITLCYPGRPPARGDRLPTPEEQVPPPPLARRAIDVLEPEIVLLVGSLAIRTFLARSSRSRTSSAPPRSARRPVFAPSSSLRRQPMAQRAAQHLRRLPGDDHPVRVDRRPASRRLSTRRRHLQDFA